MIWRGKKTKSDVEELLICLCSLVKEVPLKFEQGPEESKGANPTGARGRTLQAEGRARPKAQRQECLELSGNTQEAEVVAEAVSEELRGSERSQAVRTDWGGLRRP